MIEIIGFIAGLLTVITNVPQAIKTVRSGKTRDISLNTYILLTLGAISWAVYGVLISSLALIITNIIVALLAGVILTFKLKGDR